MRYLLINLFYIGAALLITCGAVYIMAAAFGGHNQPFFHISQKELDKMNNDQLVHDFPTINAALDEPKTSKADQAKMEERLTVALARIQHLLTDANAQKHSHPCGIELTLDLVCTQLAQIIVDTSDDPAASARYMAYLVRDKCRSHWSNDFMVAWYERTPKPSVEKLAAAIAAHNNSLDADAFMMSAKYWWNHENIVKRTIARVIGEVSDMNRRNAARPTTVIIRE